MPSAGQHASRRQSQIIGALLNDSQVVQRRQKQSLTFRGKGRGGGAARIGRDRAAHRPLWGQGSKDRAGIGCSSSGTVPFQP
jgi:hypothetical protein